MPSLADIRQQYPQYQDLSDEALADGLYRKFYSDMPREEFDRKLRGGPPAGPGGAQVPQAGVEGPSTMVAGIPSQRATALRETITGPSEGTQADWLSRQQAIERNLRSQGKADAEIERNPEWQEAARNLNRAVMAVGSSTAIGAAGGDIAGPLAARAVLPALGKVAPKAAGAVTRFLDRGATEGIERVATKAEQPVPAAAPSPKIGAPNAAPATVPQAQPGMVARTIDRVFPGATSRAVERVTKIGNPATESDLGNRMHSYLMKKLTTAENTRRATVQRDMAQAFGAKESADPIRRKFAAELEEIQKTADQELSAPERRLLDKTLGEVGLPKSVAALDKLRRELNNVRLATHWEGAEAIPKAFAARLAERLTAIMEEQNPAIATYLKNYQQMSEPINLYRETVLGKAVGREAAGFPASDVAALPKKFFTSKQSLETLKQLAGGDQAFVNSSARIHAASELDRVAQGKPIAAAARRARAWVEDNRDWLDELPDVRAATEKYVANLEATAKTQKIVKVTAALSAIPLLYETGPRAFYRGAHILGVAP